jgi:hypothetical protein
VVCESPGPWGLELLLIVLSVRSYWIRDVISHTGSSASAILTSDGGAIVGVQIDHSVPGMVTARPGLSYSTGVAGNSPHGPLFLMAGSPGRAWYAIALRYRHLALFTAALASIPWLRLRFSLRTLLIVTTLFAVALGLIVRSIGR